MAFYKLSTLAIVGFLFLSNGINADVGSKMCEQCKASNQPAAICDTINCSPDGYNSAERGQVFDDTFGLTSVIAQYGCWCDISNQLRRRGGKGPVNKLDSACKALFHAYNCIERDDHTCFPRDLNATDYNIPVGIWFASTNIRQRCNQFNPPNSCAAKTCMVEGFFMQKTWQQDYENEWFDTSIQHRPDGSFNYQQQCQGNTPTPCNPAIQECGPNPDHGNGHTECCGQLPERTEYNTGHRQCCSNQLVPVNTC